jgi:hypothetical protein
MWPFKRKYVRGPWRTYVFSQRFSRFAGCVTKVWLPMGIEVIQFEIITVDDGDFAFRVVAFGLPELFGEGWKPIEIGEQK